MKQRLAILGSTGSIGVQTLDIARENPGRFEVRVLTANRNWERLARQAREFDADAAVIADKRALRAAARRTRGNRHQSICRRGGRGAGRGRRRHGRGGERPGGLRRTRSHGGGHRGRQEARAGQQGVARGGRRLRDAAGPGAESPGDSDRLGTFGHLPVSRGRARPGQKADRHVQRRRIPRLPGRRAGRTSRWSRPCATPSGTWARRSRSTRRRS